MTDPNHLTAFELVLSEEELEHLGKFTAIFAQIDFLIIHIMSELIGSNFKNVMQLIEGTTTGTRISMLRRIGKDVQPEHQEIKTRVDGICKSMGSLNDIRNHLLHGMWGLEWNHQVTDETTDELVPACTYERNRHNSLYPMQLPEFCKRAAEMSVKLMELIQLINPSYSKQDLPHRFLIARGPLPSRPRPTWQRPPPRQSSQPNPKSDQDK